MKNDISPQRCRNFETHSWQQVGGKNDPGEGDDCQGQGGPGCSVTNLGMYSINYIY